MAEVFVEFVVELVLTCWLVIVWLMGGSVVIGVLKVGWLVVDCCC